MANTILQSIAPTKVKTSPPNLTAAEKKRVEAALTECSRLDALLDKINNLRAEIFDAGKRLAAGEITIAEAIGLAGIEPARRPEILGALRRGPKQALRDAVLAVGDIIEKGRQHEVDDLAGRCREMEANERKSAESIGIGPDDWRPSGLLEGLLEQHKRARGLLGNHPTRSDLNQLAAAVGLVSPAPAPAPAPHHTEGLDLDGEEVHSGDLDDEA